MSLKNLFQLGRRLLRGKKESATPATGQQQKLLTYEGKVPQDTGLQLAKQELRNPPVVRKQTQALYMGDKTAPAFGSSTYDWAMRIGPGKYTADEWLNHLTSTRKVNFKVFGKPATKTVREQKRFKYDSGPFAGKEVNITKEELFDTNLAVFNEAGDLTGGLLFAAKKFGLKLDANEIGAMIKLNPLNRLKAVELGTPDKAFVDLISKSTIVSKQLSEMVKRYPNTPISNALQEAQYNLRGLQAGNITSRSIEDLTKQFRDSVKEAQTLTNITASDFKILNKMVGEVDQAASKITSKINKTRYADESNYTFQGGKNYRETIFRLDEPIPTNSSPLMKPGHFSEHGTNQIYHVRFDTRMTPDGKKAFVIHEIQSDVNQSIAKQLSKAQQLGGEKRINPFQADIEMGLLSNNRAKILSEIDDALAKNKATTVQRLSSELNEVNRKIQQTYSSSGGGKYNYFPMVEADQYGDHALKYLMNKAAKENVDYVAVMPFDKLSFRQGYKAGNERFYGYASGKGINKKGSAVMPNVMKKAAKFYDSSAGPVKLSLSDPKLPYKKISTNNFQYPESHNLSNKKIKSIYHSEAYANQQPGLKFIEEGNPNLYFDAFAVKVSPLMKYTQKTYKALGGLVVDIFKPIRYN